MAAAATPVQPAKGRAPARRTDERDLVTAVMESHEELWARPDGAALVAAHIEKDLGEDEFATLPTRALADYVTRFRAAYPPAWPSAMAGDPASFTSHLKAYGAAKLDATEYQRRASNLLLAHEAHVRAVNAKREADRD